MNCLCGHPQIKHDPEYKVCDAHATEGLGRCPCPRFVPNDEIQLRVAWNRAGLYDTAARERRVARDERDMYRKECERLREQLYDEEARRLQLLDDAGGIENERDALRQVMRLRDMNVAEERGARRATDAILDFLRHESAHPESGRDFSRYLQSRIDLIRSGRHIGVKWE